LLESRRIRVVSLQLWPESPRLNLGCVSWSSSGWVNAKGIFLWGLAHDHTYEHKIWRILTEARGA
jgi:hypothetical protein